MAVKPKVMGGVTRATGAVKRRIILAVQAREKRGKSNFSLTAPAPITTFDFDVGLEGVIEKFAGEKEIHVGDYRRDKGLILDQAGWGVSWDMFKKEYTAAVTNPAMRTLVIDTATEAWEMIRLARFGPRASAKPVHYAPVNDEFRELVRLAYGSDKNLILLQKMKEEYITSKADSTISNRTGKYLLAGFTDTPYLVQMNLFLDRTEDGFLCRILDCRQNPMIAGLELYNEDINFQSIGTLVFPDTSEGDWL